MKRHLRIVALTMAIGVFALGADAEAGKRHHGSFGSSGSSGGSSGSFGSSGMSHGSCGSSGGSWGSYGSSGGSRGTIGGSSGGSFGSFGSSRGSSGSYGSHGSSGGSYGSSGGSRGSSGSASSSGGYLRRTTQIAGPSGYRSLVSSAARTQLKPSLPTTNGTHAFLVVNVPADATVILDGQKMSAAGTTRVFRVSVKTASRGSAVPMTVEVTRDGAVQRIEHTERLLAGRTHTIRVNENAAQPSQAIAAQ